MRKKDLDTNMVKTMAESLYFKSTLSFSANDKKLAHSPKKCQTLECMLNANLQLLNQ